VILRPAHRQRLSHAPCDWDTNLGVRPARLAPVLAARGPTLALYALLLAGIALRVLAAASWWPVVPTLDDAYSDHTGRDAFSDPLHPAGYGLILGALGTLTREPAVHIMLQHLLGVASALLLYYATRRVTRSGWAGLLPAAFLLLSPDQIFLEHAILSESWAVFAMSVGLAGVVWAFDDGSAGWQWAGAAGAALAVSATIRSAGTVLIPVAVLVLAVQPPGRLSNWRARWRAPLAAALGAGLILLAYATANSAYGSRFGITPSPGWYLYGRVAQFADCKQFTPPPGTRVLCDRRPPGRRPGSFTYLFNETSPAPRHFGPVGQNDALVGAWARRALVAQPVGMLKTTWEHLRLYWIPGWRPRRLGEATDLDPGLDFAHNSIFRPAIEARLRRFFGEFGITEWRTGLRVLSSARRVVRFGSTALSIATLLVLLGLLLGSRRSRTAILLFGVGGLALIVAPSLSVDYSWRYAVPAAGPLAVAAAITLTELARRVSGRRTASASAEGREPRTAEVPG
jgi:hypothetical protein